MPPSTLSRCLIRYAFISFAGMGVYPAYAENPALPAAVKADAANGILRDDDSSGSEEQDLSAPPLPNVRKLGDNDLSCAQIHAETATLQKAGEEQRAEAEAAAQEVSSAVNDMMQQAMTARGNGNGRAPGMGMLSTVSGLLNMIPGNAGMAASMISRIVNRVASQAAAMEGENASGMPDNMKNLLTKMMEVQQKMVNAEGDMYYTQARHDYLVDLFLKKDCKLSQIKTVAQENSKQD